MIYDYQCKTCNRISEDVYNTIADRNSNAPQCCGERMKIAILVAPYGYVDNMAEYVCPVTNQYVSTRRQRNEVMKREGLVDANDFLKSKDFRDKQEAKVADTRKMIEENRPKELTTQVDEWAVKDLKRDGLL